MKKTILIISLLIFVAGTASASELFGQISTNPDELPRQNEDTPKEPDDPVSPDDPGTGSGSPGHGSAIIFPNSQKQNNTDKEKKEIAESIEESIDIKGQDEDIKVLGISYEEYRDGVLLRASDKKIYVINGQFKKHIVSLSELKKYSGQIIYDVSDTELVKYQKRQHLNGDLIREQGREEIYIIENGRKRHIVSLKELSTHYFGQEIFNVNSIEIKLYPL